MAEAPEPSNILWENLHVTPRQQTCRKLLVSAVILVLLFGMFVLFTFLQLIAVKNANRYPASTDCTTVSAMFTDNATFEQYARIDEPYTVKQQGTGVYQCFCLNTFSYTQFFSYQEGVDTCYTYARQLVGGTLLSNTVAYSIVIANIIIREINIVMIKMSGNHTERKTSTVLRRRSIARRSWNRFDRLLHVSLWYHGIFHNMRYCDFSLKC